MKSSRMVVRLNRREVEQMLQMVLTNEDDIIIDSAKASTQEEIMETLAKWLKDYHFLNHDKITFYRF